MGKKKAMGLALLAVLILAVGGMSLKSHKGREGKEAETVGIQYDQWADFSHERNLPYVSQQTFEEVRGFYSEIDFFGEFQKGYTEVYGEYVEVFFKLLQSEMAFYNKETGENVYLRDFLGGEKEFVPQEAEYCFFDMNEDGFPELTVTNNGDTYIFQYDSEAGTCALWYSMEGGWYSLVGSRKVMWLGEGKYLAFYLLDREGGVECETFSFANWFNKEESLYVVMVPQYKESGRGMVTEEMKAEGIYERYSGQWYFRVTEEQWDELADVYLEAFEAAKGKRKDVTYTYEELFGSQIALENFGKYLEGLYREGRKSELNDKVISRRLSLEEAAFLAEGAPLLEHIRAYKEDELMIVTGGICILAADVNGDGVEDMIEYGPDAENADTANVLNIYLGKESGGFELTYSQPLFGTMAEWSDIIEVVRYGEEAYLLFLDRIRGDDGSWNEDGVLAAYWLSDGKPMGKLNLDYVCSDVSMVIMENVTGWDSRFLTERRLALYHVANQQHCEVSCDLSSNRYGSGEKEIFKSEKREVLEALQDSCGKKYIKQQEPYVGRWGGDLQWHYNVTNISEAYESDLNNDGVEEKYLKATKGLWMYETGFLSIGYSQGLPHITGDYYGIHEGRHGLMYYIETEGEETDFLKMCGLDIWAGEMTPLYFWVERTDLGNLIYISYQDEDEHRQRIEGYLIKADAYKRMFCAEYVPEIECSVSYETMEKEAGGVDYIVCCARDRRSFELVWEKENGSQEVLNHNIRTLLEEKMRMVAMQEGEDDGCMTIRYHPVEATREQFVVDCMIFYNNPKNTPALDHTPYFRVSINLVTGQYVLDK